MKLGKTAAAILASAARGDGGAACQTDERRRAAAIESLVRAGLMRQVSRQFATYRRPRGSGRISYSQICHIAIVRVEITEQGRAAALALAGA